MDKRYELPPSVIHVEPSAGSPYHQVDASWMLTLVALLASLSLALSPSLASAQTINFDGGTSLTGVETSASELVDIDADGDLDYILMGDTGVFSDRFETTVYVNDGTGTLTANSTLSAPFAAAENGSLSAADIDGDGDMDVLLTGSTVNGGGMPITRLYTNDGSGIFTEVTTALPDIEFSDTEFFDADADGDVDLLLLGQDAAGDPLTALYLNDGAGTFSQDATASAVFTDVRFGAIEIGDLLNNDGIPEILVAGEEDASGTNVANTELYENDGTGTFTVSGSSGDFVDVDTGDIAFSDNDLDGDLDVIINGNSDGSIITNLYRNDDGADTFTVYPFVNDNLDDAEDGTLRFIDIDNDGDEDLFLTGENQDTGGQSAVLFENLISGGFSKVTTTNFFPVQFSTSSFGDLDRDGDADLTLSGRSNTNGGEVAAYYDNQVGNANVAPSAPTGLNATVGASTVDLSWTAATDGTPAQGNPTPSANLTYNVYVEGPDGSFVVSPESITSGTNSGRRLIPNRGNGSQQTSFRLQTATLPVGTYTWSVQSIDFAREASDFAPSGTFAITNDVTLTDGSTFSAPAFTPPATNQPIGRFGIEANANGSQLTDLTVTLGGSGSGITEVALWRSTDDTFDPASDTEVANQSLGGGSVPTSVSFNGLSEAVPSTQAFFFVVVDVASDGDGTTEASIATSSDVTLDAGVLTNGSGDFPLPLSDAAVPLPVELASFDGVDRGDGAVELTWRTLSETENDGFTVERMSDAETQFSSIGWVSGAQTTTRSTSYRFVDPSVPASVNEVTYRLRQVDVDGTETIIARTVVRRAAPDEIQLSSPNPNPVRGTMANLAYGVPRPVDATIAVYDVLGREVTRIATNKRMQDRGVLQIDTSGWASGTYFIRITTEIGTTTSRLTVVR